MRLIGRVLVCVFLTSPVVAAAEISCDTPVYDLCTEQGTGTTETGGLTLDPYCVQEVGTQACEDDAPLNECSAVEVSLNCTEISEECIEYKHGECRQTRKRYSCFNAPADMAPATLLERVYGEVQEEIVSTCDGLEADPKCELANTETVEGAETRKINARDFFRDWWKRERTFMCIVPGEGDNNCGPLESDPSCVLKGDTCLVEDENGVCSNREYHYICGGETGDLQTSCEPINVCVGDTCLDIEQETSDDFGNSAAWLNILAEMQRDFRDQNTEDPNEVTFFNGNYLTCSKAPGRNCCSLSGVFVGSLGMCPDSAVELADRRNAGATHFLGSTCQEKVFGACVKRRYHYCAFNSKFGRVFIEEFRDQQDMGWGQAPNVPDCDGVTIEDIGTVDVDEMDFSPVFGDIMNSITLPVAEGIEDFFDDRFPNVEEDAETVYEGEN